MSALVQREPGMWRAARLAALWGFGHTAAFFGLGILIVLADVRLPASFDRLAELLVAVMLLGFGGWHLARSRAANVEMARTSASSYARPVLIGVVHGLAGSAAVALLAATTIPSRALATLYLALFGLGTVLGMVVLTLVLSQPISWTMRRQGLLNQGLTVFAALLSIGLGGVILARTLLTAAAP
ncbi:MAG TPA: hypothetical protein VHW01_18690 [Polyangiaceae bacterium]|nr:hypothetical protein [Polyangiaceae bacterium]